jgi:phosphoribosylformylglycinamidine cyclo-ligase
MEMFSTFNMGIGMMMFVDEKDADAVVSALKDAGEEASVIGRTVRFEKEKVIING